MVKAPSCHQGHWQGEWVAIFLGKHIQSLHAGVQPERERVCFFPTLYCFPVFSTGTGILTHIGPAIGRDRVHEAAAEVMEAMVVMGVMGWTAVPGYGKKK